MRETGYRRHGSTTVVNALCRGEDCLRGADGAALRNRAVAGLRLCRVCRERLSVRLRELPGLYVECERALGGSAPTGLREKTSGGPLPGMPFNTAAADVRTSIVATLVAWSGLVAEERGLAAPRRAVPPMVEFLCLHGDWLSAHPAAAEATEEVARLVRTARRVTRQDAPRRVLIGLCVEQDCSGELSAYVSGGRTAAPPTEIRCGTNAGHAWPGHLWTQLSRSLRRTSPPGAAERPEPSGAPAEQWLTAADVSRLWRTPIGTVYRLASDNQWRRRSRAGRTYYSEADVHACFSRRAVRSA
ncbi:hypothetical protein ABCR94_36770 [Streptomyces sp. 21So2-11]|uniref:hypothetical protein n=1 Tax=Streptomyces sp. 21So2-11 TaxID=3144408 RepID=UPI00321B739F